ncbi:hypothetical protein ACJX0J_006200, partial [Zea mays]
ITQSSCNIAGDVILQSTAWSKLSGVDLPPLYAHNNFLYAKSSKCLNADHH